MSTDFRALCAELVALDGHCVVDCTEEWADAMRRLRAALAQPEPVAPRLVYRYSPVTIAECGGPCEQGPQYCDCGTIKGEPAPEPVPPEPGVADHVTDDEGTRWHRTTDAALWAKAFCLICPEMASREDVMIGWFANAIMAGRDHQAWEMAAELKPVPVSERPILKSSPFNNSDGHCWCGTSDFIDEHGDRPVSYPASWELREPCSQDDCVLPHWALPVPANTTREEN
jgi:hypothetical protein